LLDLVGAGRGHVEFLDAGLKDVDLEALADRATRVGIDIPFGWPDTFVEALVAQRNDASWPPASQQELRYRTVDLTRVSGSSQ
jgi:hypothetical protein